MDYTKIIELATKANQIDAAISEMYALLGGSLRSTFSDLQKDGIQYLIDKLGKEKEVIDNKIKKVSLE